MSSLFHGEYREHIKLLHILREEYRNLHDILHLHLSEPGKRLPTRQLVNADHTCYSHISWHIAEPGLNQLGDVQRAMVVPTCGYGGGDDDSSCVDGLEDAFEVALTGDFFDENWCETF